MSILTPEGAALIAARKPFPKDGPQPWLMAYRTRGGGYIIANDGRQSDDGHYRDLIYVWPGGAIVALSPFVAPDLLAEVEAVVST
jgi:hypothetical protein